MKTVKQVKTLVRRLEKRIGAWYAFVEECRKEVLRILAENDGNTIDLDLDGHYHIISEAEKCELLSVSNEGGQIKVYYTGENSEGYLNFDDVAQDSITLSDFMHELYRIEECWAEENE